MGATLSSLARVKRLDWERLWAPEGRPALLDESGLLPEGLLGAENPDLASFRELGSYRCLVLLGEPGAGKSDALAEAENDGLHWPRRDGLEWPHFASVVVPG